MSLNFKHWTLAAFAWGCLCGSLSAKMERTTVYIFGFAASFTDSVAYITDIQRMDSAYVDTKSGFLADRMAYSDQLQSYLVDKKQMPHPTCTVFFHTKKDKLANEYDKIRKRYGGDESVVLKDLADGGFKFQSYAYNPPEKAMGDTSKPKAAKKGKKKKPEEDKQEKK